MGHPLKILTGLRFGRLVVIEQSGRDARNMITWKVRCDCGTVKLVVGERLNSGLTKSCRCLQRAGNHTTHGAKKNGMVMPEYHSWASAKKRVTNPNDAAYDRYGGRGIKMCPRWLNSFAAFLADMGPRPSADHSIDRYPNNDGDYEPGNCRWATAKEQANNRRPGRVHTTKLNPELVLLIRASSERVLVLAERYGVDESTIRNIRHGRTWRSVVNAYGAAK